MDEMRDQAGIRAALSRIGQALAWRRRLLAAGLAAAAVLFTVEAASPPAPDTRAVVVAATDLAGGTTLSGDDVEPAALPPEAVPDGALDASATAGAVLAGPVRAGEVLTDARIVGESLLAGWGAGTVASPVRVADAGAAALLRPGDHIDLLATPTDGTTGTEVVAAAVPVLTITASSDDVLAEGALIVVGTSSEQAAELARAAVTSHLSFTLVPH